MVVVSHLFSFYGKKFGEGVTRYESHPPSLRTVYFPTAPFLIQILFFYEDQSLVCFWLSTSASFIARTFNGRPNRVMNPSASW